MEEEIADEDRDCSLEEGNELCDMKPANEFTSFRGFECVLSAECNLVSSGGNCVWELKIEIGNT